MKVEKKIPEPVAPPPEYVITLSEEEATHIHRIAGASAGSAPEKQTLWKLFDLLKEAGVSNPPYPGLREMRIDRYGSNS